MPLAFMQGHDIKQDMRKHLVMMAILVMASVMQTLYYYPQLPDVVASHFNASGAANGWQTKRGFLGIYSGIIVLLVLLFSASAFFLDRIPDSRINLPNKEYWLSPARRAETISFINNQMLMFGNATLLFIFIIFQLVIKENLTHQNLLSPVVMMPLLGAYLLVSIIWTARFFLKFKK